MTFFQRIAYAWRTYVKLQTFFFFGLGSLVQASVVFPTLFLFSGFSRKRFSRWARYAIHIALKILIWQLVLLRGSKFKVEHRERLKGLHSKIIIANHPSLLDVVLLFSIIPNADCIVKGALGKNRFVSGIVNSIYILNSESFDQQMAEVKRTTDQGNNLIIFPEGTRSEPGKQWTREHADEFTSIFLLCAASAAVHGFCKYDFNVSLFGCFINCSVTYIIAVSGEEANRSVAFGHIPLFLEVRAYARDNLDHQYSSSKFIVFHDMYLL